MSKELKQSWGDMADDFINLETREPLLNIIGEEINWQQYICKGAHCKCMDKDCPNYHKGDHTCPFSKKLVEKL